jgi:hypothetical protein
MALIPWLVAGQRLLFVTIWVTNPTEKARAFDFVHELSVEIWGDQNQ